MWGHEHNQRLVKMMGNIGKGRTIVGVDDEKCGPASERLQVPRIQTIGFLGVRSQLAVDDGLQLLVVPLAGKEDAPQVIAQVFRGGFGGKASVSGNVEHQGSVGRQLFLAGG